MATPEDRLLISRLIHRFNFGPTPGQYASLLSSGVDPTVTTVLSAPTIDPGLAVVADPSLTDLGPTPTPGSITATAFYRAMGQQNIELILWWLDRMALAQYPLIERMTWFWHGHWATAIGKVRYALPMKTQNDTLRQYALGNFTSMAQTMIVDGALIVWLDGELNVTSAPNENLAREFMELFTLGVGNYTESDVKAAAQALTGYRVVHSSGAVSFDPRRHDQSVINFLGTSQTFTAPTLSDYVTSLSDNANFIAERLWFRFVTTQSPAPGSLADSFATRDISALVHAVATDPGMQDPANCQVKSPVEWLISACRALNVRPSTLPNPTSVVNYLSQMGQLPFDPPNVGGWPYDEAWLTSSATQYRVSLATFLVKHGDISPLTSAVGNPVQALADWLGVAQWNVTTAGVLSGASDNPAQMIVLALCAPDYVVSA